jgi:flavin-dependent dehydrogenase
VAWGPRRACILAVGYLFTTDLADGSFAVLDDRLAPQGYGYLLVHRGRATLATCLFSDFHREAQYLERVLDFFQRRLGFTMHEPRRFGGVGYIGVNPPVPDAHLFFAGEAAGVQDALWGFGIRYAVRSGSLAAAFSASGDRREYIRQWEEKIGRPLRASFVNRLVFQAGGALGYRLLLRWIAAGSSPGDRLRRLYAPAWWKSAAFPLAHRAFGREEDPPVRAGCVCSWCAARADSSYEKESQSQEELGCPGSWTSLERGEEPCSHKRASSSTVRASP